MLLHPSVAVAAALLAAAADPQILRYHVHAGLRAEELSIDATLPANVERELSVEGGAEPFVRGVEQLAGVRWLPIPARGTSWFLRPCPTSGCRIRYRFALAEAAAALGNADLADRAGPVLFAPPSTFLLFPLGDPAAARLRLHVSTAGDVRFATGLPRARGTRDEFEFQARDLERAPYSAFGPLREGTLEVGGATVRLALAPAQRSIDDAAIARWIHSSAAIIADYFGRFPIDPALVLVLATPGARIHGRTLGGGGGATVLLSLGAGVEEEELRDDWVLVHELVHLGFPSLRRSHHWAEEGLATYVEPIARARAGQISPERVWRDLLRGLPKGLPGPGDQGLDFTHTWGRTYWGGALFWLLADVRIRERTRNRRSLGDALHAVVARGGNAGAHWNLRQVLEVGDEATGSSALTELYAEMGARPSPIDLDALFQRLGVELQHGKVVFDDAAPLARVRRAITADAKRPSGAMP